MKYQNPIVRGMYPDPSICRAEDKYYMVCSTFQYFPGVPILESEDMVNWKQIGNCFTRPSQIDLKTVNSSGGVFAPTIRYHEGRFYMVTTNDTYHQNFYIYTDDIYGEWSEPIVVEQDGIDPSLFFEDGHSYFISNGTGPNGLGAVQMCEIDITTGRKLTESRYLWQGTGGRFLEAPHLYHFGDYYYLLEAEGGTEYGHMVNYGRSKSMWGPFESYPGNPVLTNRNLGGYQIQAAGHGDIVQDQDGNWWFAHLAFRQIHQWQTYHHLGRETCLVPMHWREDGWFELGVDGICPIEVELPDSISFAPQQFAYEKTFQNLSQKTDWIYLRYPECDNYRFEDNALQVKGTTVDLDQPSNPTCACVRQTEFDLDITCDITSGMQETGITFYMDEYTHYEILVDKTAEGTQVYTRQTIGRIHQDSPKVSVDSEQIRLHIVAEPMEYHFYVVDKATGKETLLSDAFTKFLSSEVAGGFTGVVIGFYAVNKKGTEEWSRFSNLKITHK